ncbi:MAG: hypothetical protein K6F44_04275 [Lachnospiraceae bacterium]|nr:hypothetical protein [Lachnospiraceae bacterium]
MAICKMCHKEIPDGRDFCDECEMKRANQADESYLDRLLSSVSSEGDPAVRRKRNEPSKQQKERPSMSDLIADVIAEEEKNSSNNNDDISSFGDDPPSEIDSMITDLLSEMPEDDPNQQQETLDPDDIADIFSQHDAGDEDMGDDSMEGDLPVDMSDRVEFSDDPIDVSDDPIDVSDDSVNVSDEVEVPDLAFDTSDQVEISDIPDITSDVTEDSDLSVEEDDPSDTPEATLDAVDPFETADAALDTVDPFETADTALDTVDPFETADTALDTVDPFGSSDDVPAVESDMVDPFGGDVDPVGAGDEPEVQFINPGDEPSEEGLLGVDDLFALDDSVVSEKDIVDIGEEPIDIMAEIESGALEDKIKALDAPETKSEKKKKKKSLFQRLFGNVVEELTEEQKEARRKKAEEEEKQKAAILEAKKKNAEEAKAAKAAQKELDKAEAEEKKKQADEAKRKAREEAREKARKKKEAREALEISEEDEGKINKVGAGILFILFGVIAAFIILGTDTYTYNLSIENAQTDFLIRHYNEAYYDVYGLQIKDEDIELYDRIMTVMYVNSQLNSYNYYMTSHNEDKALNSLIKGLEKYEKYYMLATTLGITDDLEYVKTNILNELNNKFQITESEAYSMMNINDVIDYSEYIYALLGTYDVESIKSLV